MELTVAADGDSPYSLQIQWRNYSRAGGATAPPAFEEPETVTAALIKPGSQSYDSATLHGSGDAQQPQTKRWDRLDFYLA